MRAAATFRSEPASASAKIAMLASRASADSGENGDSGLVGSAAFLKNGPRELVVRRRDAHPGREHAAEPGREVGLLLEHLGVPRPGGPPASGRRTPGSGVPCRRSSSRRCRARPRRESAMPRIVVPSNPLVRKRPSADATMVARVCSALAVRGAGSGTAVRVVTSSRDSLARGDVANPGREVGGLYRADELLRPQGRRAQVDQHEADVEQVEPDDEVGEVGSGGPVQVDLLARGLSRRFRGMKNEWRARS